MAGYAHLPGTPDISTVIHEANKIIQILFTSIITRFEISGPILAVFFVILQVVSDRSLWGDSPHRNTPDGKSWNQSFCQLIYFR